MPTKESEPPLSKEEMRGLCRAMVSRFFQVVNTCDLLTKEITVDVQTCVGLPMTKYFASIEASRNKTQF